MCISVCIWMCGSVKRRETVVWFDCWRTKYGWMWKQPRQIWSVKMLIWKWEGRGEWFVDPDHVASEGLAGFVIVLWSSNDLKIKLFLFWKSQNSLPFPSVALNVSSVLDGDPQRAVSLVFFLFKGKNCSSSRCWLSRVLSSWVHFLDCQSSYNHKFLLKSLSCIFIFSTMATADDIPFIFLGGDTRWIILKTG